MRKIITKYVPSASKRPCPVCRWRVILNLSGSLFRIGLVARRPGGSSRHPTTMVPGHPLVPVLPLSFHSSLPHVPPRQSPPLSHSDTLFRSSRPCSPASPQTTNEVFPKEINLAIRAPSPTHEPSHDGGGRGDGGAMPGRCYG